MRAVSPYDLDRWLVELNDPDLFVRQDAAIALGDCCPKNHPAVNVLIERLWSTDQTPHDRACAAWALGRIGAKASKVIPILLSVIEETRDQAESDELRSYAAESIERLTGEMDVLLKVARNCLADRFWNCRMSGLFLAKRLVKRQPDLRDSFVPLIEHLNDEAEEIRENARRVLVGSGEGV